MLAGYRMLADHCLTCNTPLMSARGSNVKICVLCDEDGGSQPLRPQYHAPAAVAPVLAPSPSATAPSSSPTGSRRIRFADQTAADGDNVLSEDGEPSTGNRAQQPRQPLPPASGLLAHLRGRGYSEDDDSGSSGSDSARAGPRAPPPSRQVSASQASSADDLPDQSTSSAWDARRWEAALTEVVHGMHADAEGGPRARILTFEQSNEVVAAQGRIADEAAQAIHAAELHRVEAIIASFDHDAAMGSMAASLAAPQQAPSIFSARRAATSSAAAGVAEDGSSGATTDASPTAPGGYSSAPGQVAGRPMFGSTIMAAPSGWQSMTQDEIRAYASRQVNGSGNAVAASTGEASPGRPKPVGSVAVQSPRPEHVPPQPAPLPAGTTAHARAQQPLPIPAVVSASLPSPPRPVAAAASSLAPIAAQPPPPAAPTSSSINPSLLSPGQLVSLRAEDGNVGSSGRVAFLGRPAFNIPEPSQGMVDRIAAGLARAAAEDAEEARREQQELDAQAAAAASAVSSVAPRGGAAAQPVTRLAATPAAAQPTVPTSSSPALSALLSQVETEKATIVRLAGVAGSGGEAVAEAMAAAAARIGKLASGIAALRLLQGQ